MSKLDEEIARVRALLEPIACRSGLWMTATRPTRQALARAYVALREGTADDIRKSLDELASITKRPYTPPAMERVEPMEGLMREEK